MRFAAAPVLIAVALIGAADKAKLTVKANPSMAFSPARIVVTADMTGGANDDPQLYCPSVEWEWDDGTRSEESADCDPYEAGKTQIKRHFTADHTYRVEDQMGAGTQPDYRDYHIQLRLRKNGKIVLSAGTTVKIKPEADATAVSRRP